MAGPTTTSDILKPFIAWNRLEGRPRKKDFESVLKAQIHDPLWMLGRQWQMGEFKSNDTGSGILARVQMNYATITQIAPHTHDPSVYNRDLPLEPIVERLSFKWSLKERILMGKKWIAFLKKESITFSTYYPVFESDSSFQYTIDKEPPTNLDTEDAIIKKAFLHSEKTLESFFAATNILGASIDGAKIFSQIINVELIDNLQDSYFLMYSTSISGGDITKFNSANLNFKNWVIKMYTLPETGIVESAWNSRTMEYQFDIFVPNNDGLNERRLSAKNYSKGNLDWFSFKQSDDTVYEAIPETKKHDKFLQLIMSSNRFAGMPSNRWWEFENGGVNFAKLDADSTDIAKIVMTQFALIYQDDWFNIPYKVPVSSASQIEGIVVSDVFGVKTLVASNKIEKYDSVGKVFVERSLDWKKWNWMDITQTGEFINEKEGIGRMLVLPVVDKIQESKPLESVLFLRDEMANLVWGVEKIVPSYLGKGIDGYEASKDFTRYLETIKPHEETEISGTDSVDTFKLNYKIASQNIPENWIPFMPVHTGENNRSIQLQRASMPRILKPYEISLVRPRTDLLKVGLDYTPVQPHFINEEEVTRAGTIVETTYQRTRWFNGRIISWVGRRKTVGRGEGSSGLTFDNIT